MANAGRRIDAWRRCIGLCCVCGQPIASPRFRAADGRVLGSNELAALDTDARLLTEESPVRLALLRYNALGEYQVRACARRKPYFRRRAVCV